VNGHVDRAFLGVTLQNVSPTSPASRLPARRVIGSVMPAAPPRGRARGRHHAVVVAGESYQLGGDMIVAIDGKPVASVDALRDAIAAHKPGDKIHISVVHSDGTKATVEATLGRVPNTPAP
jgi:S1-C subfamily serine protease